MAEVVQPRARELPCLETPSPGVRSKKRALEVSVLLGKKGGGHLKLHTGVGGRVPKDMEML